MRLNALAMRLNTSSDSKKNVTFNAYYLIKKYGYK